MDNDNNNSYYVIFTEDGRPANRKSAREDAERDYRSWEEIERTGVDPEELKEAERFCIWCGIECESVAALEVHEEDCAS